MSGQCGARQRTYRLNYGCGNPAFMVCILPLSGRATVRFPAPVELPQ